MPACLLHAHGRQCRRLHGRRRASVEDAACSILHGDKGYDSDAVRRQIEAGGAMPNIPLDSASEPMHLLGNADDNLVQKPFVAALWRATAYPRSEVLTKFLSSLAVS